MICSAVGDLIYLSSQEFQTGKAQYDKCNEDFEKAETELETRMTDMRKKEVEAHAEEREINTLRQTLQEKQAQLQV